MDIAQRAVPLAHGSAGRGDDVRSHLGVLEWILRSVTASPRDAQTFLSQEEVITFLFHEKLPTAIEFGYSASCDLETNSFHQNVRLI